MTDFAREMRLIAAETEANMFPTPEQVRRAIADDEAEEAERVVPAGFWVVFAIYGLWCGIVGGAIVAVFG